MAFDIRKPPLNAVEHALYVVNEVWHGKAGQTRGENLRSYIKQMSEWMQEVVKLEERAASPQLLLDLNQMFQALNANGITGTIAQRVAPPGPGLPGEYSIETEYGKFIGEAAQLANTINLLATGIRANGPPPTSGPSDGNWPEDDTLDEFNAEHGE